MTTWTSSRYPSRNVGRSGRSISRQVRIAVSDGRPSRRKKLPGIFPIAYIRSSTSIVSGKKSIPSRGLELTQVPSTCVSPYVAMTAPSASLATRPASNVNVWFPILRERVVMAMGLFLLGSGGPVWSASAWCGRRRAGQLSVVSLRAAGAQGAGGSGTRY